MRFHRFVLTTLLLTSSASLFGQAPASGQRDFVFFNHATPGERIGPGPINDELIQRVRSTLNLSDVQVGALKTLLTMREQTTQQTLQSIARKSEKTGRTDGPD